MKIFYLIGSSITQSLSWHIHGWIYENLKIKASYENKEIATQNFNKEIYAVLSDVKSGIIMESMLLALIKLKLFLQI